MTFNPDKLRFDVCGLIPAIIQDDESNEVLMMAYMNEEALQKTLAGGQTWFWSRSRQELWHKGATSGHYQEVREISYDCDADCLLVKVKQTGAACHTGARSCFHNLVFPEDGSVCAKNGTDEPTADIIKAIYEVVLSRKKERPPDSYTTYLFSQGLDKILKKIGEEAAEVIIGAKNGNREEIVYEVADLLYHLLVLLGDREIEPREIYRELAARRK